MAIDGKMALDGENITVDELVFCARTLISEDGENPEYDRALVELVRDVTPFTREEVTKILRQRVQFK